MSDGINGPQKGFTQGGFEDRFRVTRVDGKPINARARYLILDYSGRPAWLSRNMRAASKRRTHRWRRIFATRSTIPSGGQHSTRPQHDPPRY